jgi:hypothetical protein
MSQHWKGKLLIISKGLRKPSECAGSPQGGLSLRHFLLFLNDDFRFWAVNPILTPFGTNAGPQTDNR